MTHWSQHDSLGCSVVFLEPLFKSRSSKSLSKASAVNHAEGQELARSPERDPGRHPSASVLSCAAARSRVPTAYMEPQRAEPEEDHTKRNWTVNTDVFAMLQERHRNPIRDLDRAGLLRYLDRRGNYQITLLGWIVSQGDMQEFLRHR